MSESTWTRHAWTDAEKATLRTAWEAGVSLDDLTRQFHMTVGQVMGMTARFGLKKRSAGGRPKRQPDAVVADREAQPARGFVAFDAVGRRRRVGVPAKAMPAAAPVTATAVTLEDIGRDQCRWPVGEETGSLQLFCGALKDEGSSYCCEHRLTSPAARPRLPVKSYVRTLARFR